ncbi:conserved hypothetical protein [Microsporum canis CBS 113480]|uniref:Uncharacterized protein n=1 Tax=Arthroderma otae (strain ATCC MYA-4605 / CBS 113480) TaxID=554155 RepID=C5FC70_ARTOC|nr:conserved hypothetical protein [Microsporum canis CBS 113480]EEQ27493.1 conserved hypothetical protein [Microsporum canis CBS 113480]
MHMYKDNQAHSVQRVKGEAEWRIEDIYRNSEGTKPYQSSKDKTDKKDVVTIGYYTKDRTRVLSIHAHEDGTWNEFFSRAGKALLSFTAQVNTNAIICLRGGGYVLHEYNIYKYFITVVDNMYHPSP